MHIYDRFHNFLSLFSLLFRKISKIISVFFLENIHLFTLSSTLPMYIVLYIVYLCPLLGCTHYTMEINTTNAWLMGRWVIFYARVIQNPAR